ncbi:hypothetical protein [Metapseudomonas sp. CR1201]
MRAIPLILAATLLTGCAIAGKKITEAQMHQVVPGQSDREDLIAIFGRPISETIDSDGNRTLGWSYVNTGFMGIGTEIQSVGIQLGPDGTVSKFTRGGTAPVSPYERTIQPPAKPGPTSQQSAPLSRDQWKQQQLDQLNRETGLSYEEYQRRYKAITGQ